MAPKNEPPWLTALYTTIGVIVILIIGVAIQVIYEGWRFFLVLAIGLCVVWWFQWSPWARDAQRRQEIQALYEQAKATSEALALPAPDDFARDVLVKVSERLGGLLPPCSGLMHYMNVPAILYHAENLTAERLAPPPAVDDKILLGRYRDDLSARIVKMQQPNLIDLVAEPLVDGLADFLSHLPRPFLSTDEQISACADGTLQQPRFSISMLDMLHSPGQAVEDLILPYYAEKIRSAGLFTELRAKLDANLDAVDKQMPSDRKAAGAEIVKTYLRDTPLALLFEAQIPFDFPETQRLEHAVIVAGSGHGKTQTLEALICDDLSRDDPPGMVVIDSKGDMINRLAKLDVFNPDDGRLKDRLIIVDAHDGPSLNPFDIRLDTTDSQAVSRIIGSMSYFFRSLLGSELSGPMRVALVPFLHLMVRIPGATLQTLIEAMADPKPHANVIAALPEAPRNYLQSEYARVRPETRNAVKDRIYDLRLMSPAFDQMFSAPRNCLDLPRALNEGKIVLVNLDREFLEKEPSAILGKWFISQTHRAALRRNSIPPLQRRAAYLVVDEAAPYFDEQTEEVLRTMRSYRVGALLAFQDFGPVSVSLKSAISSNTSIRLAGGKIDDLNFAARLVSAEPAFIRSQSKKDYAYSDFACYVDRLTSAAVSLRIPHGAVDQLPRMTDEQYDRLRKLNRAKLTELPSSAPSLNPWPKEVEPGRLDKAGDADIEPSTDWR
jgi:Type IV secretion-system coupling protein DNA-binding domain